MFFWLKVRLVEYILNSCGVHKWKKKNSIECNECIYRVCIHLFFVLRHSHVVFYFILYSTPWSFGIYRAVDQSIHAACSSKYETQSKSIYELLIQLFIGRWKGDNGEKRITFIGEMIINKCIWWWINYNWCGVR